MRIRASYKRLTQPIKPLHLFGDISCFEILCPEGLDGVDVLPVPTSNTYWVQFNKGGFESEWFRAEEGFTDLSKEVLKPKKEETLDDI